MENNWYIQGSSELAEYFKTLPDVNWVGNNSNNYYYLDSDNTWTFNYFNYLSKTVITLKEYLNMNNKEIIGYKVKPEFIEVVRQIMTTKGYNPLFEFNGNSLTYTTLTGLRVLDLWCTEIYKQDVPTFKVGDIVVVTNNAGSSYVNKDDTVKIISKDLGCRHGLEYQVEKTAGQPCAWVKSVRKATDQEIKKYNIPKFKVGDYIVFEHMSRISEVYCLAIVNGANSKDDQGGCRDLNCGSYRYATPEEIATYISKPKEFLIHSTSGNFKVEVSSKGIYVPSEKTWIDPNDLDFSEDIGDYNTVEYNEDNKFSGVDSVKHWNITSATVHVGCKKNIPVEDIKAAVDYYNSL